MHRNTESMHSPLSFQPFWCYECLYTPVTIPGEIRSTIRLFQSRRSRRPAHASDFLDSRRAREQKAGLDAIRCHEPTVRLPDHADLVLPHAFRRIEFLLVDQQAPDHDVVSRPRCLAVTEQTSCFLERHESQYRRVMSCGKSFVFEIFGWEEVLGC